MCLPSYPQIFTKIEKVRAEKKKKGRNEKRRKEGKEGPGVNRDKNPILKTANWHLDPI